MSETLKPCPFCGSTDLSIDCSESWPSFVVCRACKTYGPSFDDENNESVARLESGAIAAWNRRTPAEPTPSASPGMTLGTGKDAGTLPSQHLPAERKGPYR